MARAGAGTGNLVSVGNVSPLSITGTEITLAAWINPTAIANQSFISKWGSGVEQYILFSTGGGKLGGGFANLQFPASSASLVANVWTHVTARMGVVPGSTVLINGVQNGSVGGASAMSNMASAVNLGPVAGRIAECGIWNVALSDNEIVSLATGVPPSRIRPGSLKGYWPLWGAAFPEPDLSGNRNSGTQTGTLSAADHAPVGPYAPN